ncbi:hypothetical protein ZOSMA_157G00270 [Zostera marina]|uniref:PABC domain-containing protein n=1 Tax=Zostera marina TaxID=29655 RepID=A0A0K9PXH2_ZOSMR|nr:hypothetical protein ZOSMA_157G00270 [Zostera marina]
MEGCIVSHLEETYLICRFLVQVVACFLLHLTWVVFLEEMPLYHSLYLSQHWIHPLLTLLLICRGYYTLQMLRESLYPLVDQIEHDMVAKVTGMLLEMDQTEVLHLLESPEALKAKVGEAMEVLRNVVQQQQQNTPVDQLAGLSLK